MERNDGADQSEWVAGEGARDGKTIIVRARKFPAGAVPMPKFGVLLVIEVGYETFDETGLPFKEQYDQAELFEQTIFDVLERRGQLKFVFAETGDGKIRYFSYVPEAATVLAYLQEKVGRKLPVEIHSGHDAGWAEYNRRITASGLV